MFKTYDNWLIQSSLAAVWLYQGVWCKVVARDRRHRAIVEAAGMGWALRGIGLAEGALAVWILSGWRLDLAAVAQTATILVMNVGGLWRGRRWISDPAGMILQNAAFLVLAWVAAGVIHVG